MSRAPLFGAGWTSFSWLWAANTIRLSGWLKQNLSITSETAAE